MRRIRPVSQLELTDCGPACLAMVLAHFGHHVSVSELREACDAGRDGVSAAALASVAVRYGLEARGYRLPASALGRATLPAILHWKQAHFVVLERAEADWLVVIDPATGRRPMSWDDLAASYSGLCLSFARGAAFKKRRRQRRTRARVRSLVAHALPMMALIVGCTLSLDLFSLAVPAATKLLFDAVVPMHNRTLLLAIAFVALFAMVMRALLIATRWRMVHGLRARFDSRLARDLLAHMLSLPLGFFAARGRGALAARVQSLLSLRDAVVNVVSGTFDAVLVLFFAAILLVFDPVLGALVLGLLFVRLGLTILVRRRVQELASRELVARARATNVLTEAFASPETLKAYGLEALMQMRFEERRVRELDARAEAQIHGELPLHAIPLIEMAITASVIGFGGARVMDGTMSLGVFAAFLTVEGLVRRRASSMLDMLAEAGRIAPSLDEVDDIWDAAAERSGGEEPDELRGAIQVENLSAVYPGSRTPVVRGVDISIAVGEHVAVVGASGSGKSTLLRVLSGSHPAASGAVRFDGKPIEQLSLAWLRRRIGLVTAAGHIFEATLRYNLALGANVADDLLVHALEELGLAELLERRDGLDSPFSATVLSAGQRQRLLLARALLKRPRILLLDEASSDLDGDSQERVIAAIARRTDCTVVSVTHRPRFMQAADRICVMSEGAVVAEGRFADLISRCSLFRALASAPEEAA